MASIIRVDKIEKPDGNQPSLSDLGILPGIASVNRAFYNVRTTMTGTASGYTVVPNLSVTINPVSVNSQFLIFARVFGEGTDSDSHNWSMTVFRNGSAINTGTGGVAGANVMVTAGSDYHADDRNSTPQTWNGTTLDSPGTTSPVTYDVRMTNQGGTTTFYLNGTIGSTASAAYERGSSELIVLELALS